MIKRMHQGEDCMLDLLYSLDVDSTAEHMHSIGDRTLYIGL
jgi:hypothetical protein